ncbi:MAG: type II toxin-antitoxin system RelE/ParE family toxin [bacterium]|nr:type II toxin-antitoxin system RelE/ParE family toxin [bacterium]
MPDEYSLEISPAAKRDLKRLPVSTREEIVFTHLPAIKDDPISTSSPLVGALKKERSYHFGRKPEYRIVFYVEDTVITVTIIGSRENIYKRAGRRKRK